MMENPKTCFNALKYASDFLPCGPNFLFEDNTILLAFSKWSK
jgi:hypothetical protein